MPLSSPSLLTLTWVLSTISGYGIYGVEIVRQFLRRGGLPQQVILTQSPAVAVLPPHVQQQIGPVFAMAAKLQAFLREHPDEILSFKHAVLHGCSSNFTGFPGQERIWGKPNVACAAIEHLICNDYGRQVAKNYDMFVAISRWNEEYLKSLNVGAVHLCYQGIDADLFYPAPRTGQYGDRFVIFSGGKFEFRKGQDIALAAFKRFRSRHPDALLVTCWQNLIAPDPAPFIAAGYCQTVPQRALPYGLQITPWLLEQGLPLDSFVDLPFTHNLLMPGILRECDAAIFPNRCEGGTNLVAMECMACGIPTYVSYNTGQKDLADLIGTKAFKMQKTVKPSPAMLSVQDWGETDVDEVVASLEYIYTQRDNARTSAGSVAAAMKDWQWGQLNDKLLDIVCGPKESA